MSDQTTQQEHPAARSGRKLAAIAVGSPQRALEVLADLRVEDVPDRAARAVLRAVSGLALSEARISRTTVLDWLDDRGEIPTEEAREQVLDVLAEPAPEREIQHHLERVRAAGRREALQASTAAWARAAVDVDPTPEGVAEFEETLASGMLQIVSGPNQAGKVQALDLAAARRDRIMELQRLRLEGRRPASSTGSASLDAALRGGFRRGQSVVLAARPGMGKSALALQLAESFGGSSYDDDPPRVLFISCEMSAPEIADRSMIRLVGPDFTDASDHGLEPELAEIMLRRASANARRQERIEVHYQPGITLAQLNAAARAAKLKLGGLDLIVTDYAGLVKDPTASSRYEEVSRVARGAKEIAGQLDCTHVLLSQLNRNVESRTPPLPQLSDLKESGELEESADVVLLLYRPAYYMRDGDPDKKTRALHADVLIPKVRNGTPSTVHLNFDPARMLWSEREWSAFDGPAPDHSRPNRVHTETL